METIAPMRHMITENWTEEMQWANQRYLPKYSLMGKKCAKGGFQLLDLIITELKSHMTC